MTAASLRAEHVGSLLRPQEVIDARAAFAEGRLGLAGLRSVEDAAALDALELQRSVGLDVYTDGEVRRGSWLGHFWEALEGVVPVDSPTLRIEWHDLPEGMSQEDLQLDSLAVGDTLRRKLPLTEIEADFLLAHAPGRFKLTVPSPSMATSLYRPGVTDRVYPTPDAMVADVARLQIEELTGLVARGASWIQLDSLRYVNFLDAGMRERLTALGLDPAAALADAVAVDNAVIAAVKQHGDVTVGLHVCRGNNRSAWAVSGGYEPVAEQLFGQVEADRVLLEYDTERAGGFEPLRFVPPGKTVVLGLVSSKTPRLEPQDELRRRIDEAAKHVPLENLALSPQCGFASTLRGNLLTVDDQRRKLELVVETASKVWG
jgi:5-methyltetrahydropteroyltriglutamate--homocysteine methyltransferase